MKKITLLSLFVLSLIPLASHSVEIKLSNFRLEFLVYYQVLYQLQGIPLTEFKNVTVIADRSNELVFEYAGKRYTASFYGQGAIYVAMPDGMRNRLITQKRFPPLILADRDGR